MSEDKVRRYAGILEMENERLVTQVVILQRLADRADAYIEDLRAHNAELRARVEELTEQNYDFAEYVTAAMVAADVRDGATTH